MRWGRGLLLLWGGREGTSAAWARERGTIYEAEACNNLSGKGDDEAGNAGAARRGGLKIGQDKEGQRERRADLISFARGRRRGAKANIGGGYM